MKRFSTLLLLLMGVLSTVALAGDVYGEGVNHGGKRALTEWLTLTLVSREDGKLYPRLRWSSGEGRFSATTFGHGVPQGEAFIYFWDDQEQVFWFSDRKTLVKMEMAGAQEGSTSSTSLNAPSNVNNPELPEKVRVLLKTLFPPNAP